MVQLKLEYAPCTASLFWRTGDYLTRLSPTFVCPFAAMDQLPLIRKLPKDVIDRIAAGEVIIRPRNVVKELLENSLDAGSRNINITIKFDGDDCKCIKVKDDGHGMLKDDLKAACERFYTSKLQTFKDLYELQTLGFRGEALSSMAQVARIKINTRTRDMQYGFSMSFEEGKPVENEPRICPMNKGTVVSVEELFYNNHLRRNTMKPASEEYRMIVELVSLYSLDNLNVGFGLEREGSNRLEIKTSPDESFIQRVKSVISTAASDHLVQVKVADDSFGLTSVDGFVGDYNSCLKSFQMVFFINHRLVDCQPLKLSLERLYKSRLARGNYPFVFLSICIVPQNLDVNIHPTKSEVRFLYEDKIITRITEAVESVLGTKTAQKLLSDAIRTSSLKLPLDASIQRPQKSRPETKVRSDPTDQSIDGMFKRQKVQQELGREMCFRQVRLKSVLELREDLLKVQDAQLKRLLLESTYVGSPEDGRGFSYIQHKTVLLRIDLKQVSQKLFYQIFLDDFGNFGMMHLSQPVPIRDLLACMTCPNQVKEKLEAMLEKRQMLYDYFSLEINDKGEITRVPILLNGYSPDWIKLGPFLMDLVSIVDWSQEVACFRTFGQVLSEFYAVSPGTPEPVIKDFVYPMIKRKLKPPNNLKLAFNVVTDVPELYRVFHRC